MLFIILPELVGNKPCSDHLWEDIKYRYFPKLLSKSISKRKISRPNLILLFPALLNYTWQIKIVFKVYNVMFRYAHTLWNDYDKLINISITLHSYHFVLCGENT